MLASKRQVGGRTKTCPEEHATSIKLSEDKPGVENMFTIDQIQQVVILRHMARAMTCEPPIFEEIRFFFGIFCLIKRNSMISVFVTEFMVQLLADSSPRMILSRHHSMDSIARTFLPGEVC